MVSALQSVSCCMKDGFSLEKVIYKTMVCFWRGERHFIRKCLFFLIHLCWNLAAHQSCCSVSQWVSISFIKSWLSFHHSSKKIGTYQELQRTATVFYVSKMFPVLMNDNSCSQHLLELPWLCNFHTVKSVPTVCNSYDCWGKRNKG